MSDNFSINGAEPYNDILEAFVSADGVCLTMLSAGDPHDIMAESERCALLPPEAWDMLVQFVERQRASLLGKEKE